jgi:hypothetical protein
MIAPPQGLAKPRTRRQRRVNAAILLVVTLAVAIGLIVWTSSHPATYEGSRDGCVNITYASTTGGLILHKCGADARSFCRTEFARDDAFARTAQPQCLAAGYRPKRSR